MNNIDLYIIVLTAIAILSILSVSILINLYIQPYTIIIAGVTALIAIMVSLIYKGFETFTIVISCIIITFIVTCIIHTMFENIKLSEQLTQIKTKNK